MGQGRTKLLLPRSDALVALRLGHCGWQPALGLSLPLQEVARGDGGEGGKGPSSPEPSASASPGFCATEQEFGGVCPGRGGGSAALCAARAACT